MKKYEVEYRTIFDRETRTIKNVYSPIIYKKDNGKVFISMNGKIMEFEKREDALKQAEKTYNKLVNKQVNWIKIN